MASTPCDQHGHFLTATRRTDTNWTTNGGQWHRYSGPVTYTVIRCERCAYKPDPESDEFAEIEEGLRAQASDY